MRFLKIIYKGIEKISIYFTILFILIFSVITLGLNKIEINEIKQNIPTNMAYIESDKDLSENDFLYKTSPIPLAKEEIYNVDNPYNTTTNIKLDDLVYSDNITESTVLKNQDLIKNGYEIQNIKIKYNYNNNVINSKGINIENPLYNIEKIVIGKYPENTKDVLIGESTANYYMEKTNVDSYEQLLGKEINIKTDDCIENEYCVNDNFKISGVYSSIDGEESFIINSENIDDVEFRNAYFLKFDSKKELKEYLEKNQFNVIYTNKSLKKIPYTLIIKSIIIIIGNILIILFYKTRIQEIYLKLRFYGYSKIKTIIISSCIFIIYNTFMILLLIQ